MFNRWEAVGVWTASSKICLFAYFRLPFETFSKLRIGYVKPIRNAFNYLANQFLDS